MDKEHIGAQKGTKLGEETKLFLKERTAAGNTISGIRSGFNNIDMHTLGFQPGQLITICSYGFNSRTFMMQLIYNMAVKNQVPGRLYSFDIDYKRFPMEMIRLATKLPLYGLYGGMLKENQLKEAELACYYLPDSLKVDSLYYYSDLEGIYRKINGDVHNTKEVVFIDSLNSLDFDDSLPDKKDRILRILRKLKGLAIELQIPIIVNYFAEGSEEENNLVKETDFMQLYSNIHFALYREELRSDDIIDVYNLEIFNKDLMQHKVREFMLNKEYNQFEEVIN